MGYAYAPYVAMAAYGYYTSKQAKKAEEDARNEARAAEERALQRQLEAEERARQTWEETAFPSKGVVAGMKKEGKANLARVKLGSYEQMASNLASRGMGPGSGLMVGGSEELEKGYMQAMGSLTTELDKWGESPMWQMPGGGYGGYSPYIAPTYTSGGGSALDTAFGMYMAKMMMGGYGGGGEGWPNVETGSGGMGGGYGY